MQTIYYIMILSDLIFFNLYEFIYSFVTLYY